MKSHQGEICLEKKMYEPKHTAKEQGVNIENRKI